MCVVSAKATWAAHVFGFAHVYSLQVIGTPKMYRISLPRRTRREDSGACNMWSFGFAKVKCDETIDDMVYASNLGVYNMIT